VFIIVVVVVVVHTEDSHMSPGVLASVWREEETRTKILEQKMKELLVGKEVSQELL